MVEEDNPLPHVDARNTRADVGARNAGATANASELRADRGQGLAVEEENNQPAVVVDTPAQPAATEESAATDPSSLTLTEFQKALETFPDAARLIIVSDEAGNVSIQPSDDDNADEDSEIINQLRNLLPQGLNESLLYYNNPTSSSAASARLPDPLNSRRLDDILSHYTNHRYGNRQSKTAAGSNSSSQMPECTTTENIRDDIDAADNQATLATAAWDQAMKLCAEAGDFWMERRADVRTAYESAAAQAKRAKIEWTTIANTKRKALIYIPGDQTLTEALSNAKNNAMLWGRKEAQSNKNAEDTHSPNVAEAKAAFLTIKNKWKKFPSLDSSYMSVIWTAWGNDPITAREAAESARTVAKAIKDCINNSIDIFATNDVSIFAEANTKETKANEAVSKAVLAREVLRLARANAAAHATAAAAAERNANIAIQFGIPPAIVMAVKTVSAISSPSSSQILKECKDNPAVRTTIGTTAGISAGIFSSYVTAADAAAATTMAVERALIASIEADEKAVASINEADEALAAAYARANSHATDAVANTIDTLATRADSAAEAAFHARNVSRIAAGFDSAAQAANFAANTATTSRNVFRGAIVVAGAGAGAAAIAGAVATTSVIAGTAAEGTALWVAGAGAAIAGTAITVSSIAAEIANKANIAYEAALAAANDRVTANDNASRNACAAAAAAIRAKAYATDTIWAAESAWVSSAIDQTTEYDNDVRSRDWITGWWHK